MHGEIAFQGSASWTLNENATQTIWISSIGHADSDSDQMLVCIKNASAVVSLSVQINNLIPFDSTPEAVELIPNTAFVVPIASTTSLLVTALAPGAPANLVLTKSAATAPAFAAYVTIMKA